jgi:hypothetical protein
MPKWVIIARIDRCPVGRKTLKQSGDDLFPLTRPVVLGPDLRQIPHAERPQSDTMVENMCYSPDIQNIFREGENDHGLCPGSHLELDKNIASENHLVFSRVLS